MSADPTMQFPESTQGFNRYTYAGNDSLTNFDPSGFGFFSSLLKIIGFILNFVPGFQGWSHIYWKMLIEGFLSAGGNLKGALINVVTAGLGGKLSAAFGKIKSITDTMAKIAGNFVAGVAVGVAMGQKLGAAVLGTARGMAEGYLQAKIAIETGIADAIASASIAMTKTPPPGVQLEATVSTANGGDSECSSEMGTGSGSSHIHGEAGEVSTAKNTKNVRIGKSVLHFVGKARALLEESDIVVKVLSAKFSNVAEDIYIVEDNSNLDSVPVSRRRTMTTWRSRLDGNIYIGVRREQFSHDLNVNDVASLLAHELVHAYQHAVGDGRDVNPRELDAYEEQIHWHMSGQIVVSQGVIEQVFDKVYTLTHPPIRCLLPTPQLAFDD